MAQWKLMWLTKPCEIQLLFFFLPSPVSTYCAHWRDPFSAGFHKRIKWSKWLFSQSPKSYWGALGLDPLAEPQWRGAAVLPARDTFPISWPGNFSQLKCHLLQETFPEPHSPNLDYVSLLCPDNILYSPLLAFIILFYNGCFLISAHTHPSWTGGSIGGKNSRLYPQSLAVLGIQ